MLQLRNPGGLKFHDGDDVIHFRHHERIVRIVAHPVEMIQVAVGAVDPLSGKGGKPAATRGMKIRDQKDFARTAGKRLGMHASSEGGRC